MKYRSPVPSVLLILPLLFCMGLRQPASAQQPGTSAPLANAPLSTEKIVEHLVEMNRERAEALRSYQGTRIYRVDYRGFPGARSAEMVVDVKYQSPGTKEFTIQSATGSNIIIDKVFKKLLQAEKEALTAEAQKRTALNGDNYEFTLVGYENTSMGSMYVLMVKPRTKDKFLYRGRIWVDAEDFAVARVEAEPAKNPSFWTKKAEILQEYVKVSDFWLPVYNRSVTDIRLGGHAELTIDYKDYQITGASRVSSLSRLRLAQHAEPARAR